MSTSRIRRLRAVAALMLRLRRETKDMDEALKKAIIAIVDGALTAIEGITALTPTLKDDELVKKIRSWREMLRPIVGATDDQAQS